MPPSAALRVQHRPRRDRALHPEPPTSRSGAALLTLGVLVAVTGHAPLWLRAAGVAALVVGFARCRVTLHQQRRWTTRRIVVRAVRGTIGALVEATADEARRFVSPPRGRHALLVTAGGARVPTPRHPAAGAW